MVKPTKKEEAPPDCDSTCKEYCESFYQGKGCKYLKECKIYPNLWKKDDKPIQKQDVVKISLGLALLWCIKGFIKRLFI